MATFSLPTLKGGIKLDIPLSVAALMLVGGAVSDYPLNNVCLIGAMIGIVFFMAREADRLFTGRGRTAILVWWMACLCVLFVVNIPLALIMTLLPGVAYARRHRAQAALSDDFLDAMKDRGYRLIILALLFMVATAALYGFKVVPKIMDKQAIELESYSKVSI
ncbi:hypothetical protein [Micavibrio aeruginosavorus]|uniref:Uncharacterized protein n=1 Tax=Micavibrio aeruginosavorus EPB TaxID=349215 RepID=M4VJB8_9BACT|nr:hypothetical protein [Micavibrio aeruginosavorus]AGH98575.1 hypothetical protein A11S_1773 [Micavibrio aeruginosavorus EPB]